MNHPINKKSPIPRYFQVVKSLKKRIKKGEFREGQALPSERLLTSEYDVSRITVVKAMDELKNAGIVESQQGRGTFVKSQSVINRSTFTAHQYFFQQGDKHRWEVKERSWLTSPQAVINAFDLSSNELHFRATVLLSIAHEPTAIYMAHIPRRIAMTNQLESQSNTGLLTLLRDNKLVTDNTVQQSIEAVAANKISANLLNIRTGKPMLAMDSLYLDATKRVEQYTHTVFRGDRFRYQC
ncbi:GntR family transcriptional regulator [Oceanicoccus sp. KOV_DT_Chl]|uniref:GntR family transcriptional regulator n=1 Tax=Oceanicoccus sp. KOV_DT_Chl TaxID=1904639 RepID=UPI001358F4A2|nr:GntR family transcriptional regulator [Oceanicoccus sp. KOV_DT_Chl]